MGLLCCAPAAGQDPGPPTLTISPPVPGGVRTSVTERWGTFYFTLKNYTDIDRRARVLAQYEGRTDVQYGRDVWVPAHSSLTTWMLMGPAVAQDTFEACDIEYSLHDLTGGQDHVIAPRGEKHFRSRAVPYHQKRGPYTVILQDDEPEIFLPGQLPQPDSRSEETFTLAHVFRHASGVSDVVQPVRWIAGGPFGVATEASQLSELVQPIPPGPLPPTVTGFDGIEQFILASGQLADDPAGLQALRRWLERGGRLWVMLDWVGPETLAPLLGDAFDFQVVDRVRLTTIPLVPKPAESGAMEAPPPPQEHRRPVEFVRVLLPAGEKALYTVNGWPALFTRSVGRGKVVFTTLGPRAWFRRRDLDEDPPSPFPRLFPYLPVFRKPLETVASEMQPASPEDTFPEAALKPLLKEEIGFSVVPRATVGLVFGAFLAAGLGAGFLLRRLGRAEWLGWLGPAAALGAAGLFFGLGEASRQATPPTVAAGQVVEAVSGKGEAAVHGLLALYQPGAGLARAGTSRGGAFRLDPEAMKLLKGHILRLVMTDLDAWHWENLDLPGGGILFAPFQATVPTGKPITATARFGPEGLEGKLNTGPFTNLGDSLLNVPHGRRLAVRLSPDGSFRTAGRDVLPTGQFLEGAVLSDRQQRRQAVYRKFLDGKRREGRLENGLFLLAWANPADLHFTFDPEARKVGDALLVVPLALERPAPGTRVSVPGPFIPCRAVKMDGVLAALTTFGAQGNQVRLRFQLPAEVLPLQVERARLDFKITAPGRSVIISGLANGKPVELGRVKSPLDPIRLDITREDLLRLDGEGGLRLNLAISGVLEGGRERAGKASQDETWKIEYLELEVVGRVQG